MAHLSSDELLDVADGSREAPEHLAACEACRRQLAEVRSVMASIADVDVPEPSPLFWDHLSARVGEAVRAEGAPRSAWWPSWRIGVPAAVLAAVAAVMLAVWVGRPQLRETTGQTASQTAQPAVVEQAAGVSGTPPAPVLLGDGGDDPSFAFVVGLADDINMDPATAAGLAGDGAADHAVSHLSENELRALAELLKEQIPNGRAS